MEKKADKSLEDLIFRLEYINDNLFLVKNGIVDGNVVDTGIIDNALYMTILNLEGIIEDFKEVDKQMK